MTETRALSEAASHLQRWFASGMSGCYFANAITASPAGVAWVDHLEALAAEEVPKLEGTIDDAGALGQVVVVLFPRARGTRDAADLLRTLVTSPRWSVSEVPWTKAPREGCTLVGLRYRTRGNDLSSVMGLAPFGEMPVTRRAPYMSLALWAGGRENELSPASSPGEVGFPDGPLPASISGKFQDRWDRTLDKVGRLLVEPAEARRSLRHVAFCLPTSALAGLLPAGPIDREQGSISG